MSRLDPNDRRNEILKSAMTQAKVVGYQNITRDSVADGASCSTGLVTRYFNTMGQLKRAVMRAAVHDGDAIIVAQGLAANDPQAKKASDALRQKAAKIISG